MAGRGNTTERGYGWAHQQARLEALAGMADGQLCTRCRQPMCLAQARLLDLDHADDRQSYRGLAHRRCNRSAGQANATHVRMQRQSSMPKRKRSRNW
jgi:hypothetical protein